MLRKLVERSKEWPMGPAVVNAAYDPTQNSISKSDFYSLD